MAILKPILLAPVVTNVSVDVPILSTRGLLGGPHLHEAGKMQRQWQDLFYSRAKETQAKERRLHNLAVRP